MLTMLPLRPSASARRQNTCEQSHAPRRLTSTRRVHCSSVSSRNGTIVSMPALLTRMSIGPSSFQTLSIIGFDVRTLGDVALDRDRPAARGAERLHDLFGLRGCDVVHRDVGALRRRTPRRCRGRCRDPPLSPTRFCL